MKASTTLQIFQDNTWTDAASLTPARPSAGAMAPMDVSYALDYALTFAGQRGSAALSWCQPVTLETYRHAQWPAYLIDHLPQGFGRQELLRQLGLPERAESAADWTLLTHGAGNPIGHVRVKEAFEYIRTRAADAVSGGFSFEEVAKRGESFTEYLASHGLFVAGSSGVQGEWPKILLVEDEAGRLHLDHDLPDARARRHWLVKFARGTDQALAKILRLEASWMRLAKHLGLQTQGIHHLYGRALFVQRFDRQVVTSQKAGAARVLRHSQESLYALCGVGGFAGRLTHNTAVQALVQAATDPQATLLEYLRRDIANIVLGNKDNHGRNTAVSRMNPGVALTPLFDFCPMYLHPDGIARRTRWEDAHGQLDQGSPDWRMALAVVTRALGPAQTKDLRDDLRDIGERVATLIPEMRALDVDEDVIHFLRPAIEHNARLLSQL